MRRRYVIHIVGEIHIGSSIRYYSGKLRISKIANCEIRDVVRNIIVYFKVDFDQVSLGTDSLDFIKIPLGIINDSRLCFLLNSNHLFQSRKIVYPFY